MNPSSKAVRLKHESFPCPNYTSTSILNNGWRWGWEKRSWVSIRLRDLDNRSIHSLYLLWRLSREMYTSGARRVIDASSSNGFRPASIKEEEAYTGRRNHSPFLILRPDQNIPEKMSVLKTRPIRFLTFLCGLAWSSSAPERIILAR